MSDGSTFPEMLVSKLGTPYEPFGLADVLGLCALLVAIGVYFVLEYGLGSLMARLFRRARTKAQQEREPPLDG